MYVVRATAKSGALDRPRSGDEHDKAKTRPTTRCEKM